MHAKLLMLLAALAALPAHALAQELGPAPRLAPDATVSTAPRATTRAASTLSLASPFVDTTRRNSVVGRYRSAYLPTTGVLSGWTGNLAGCNEGTTDAAFKDAMIGRANFYRAMVGLPFVGVDLVTSASTQKAALMFSANNDIDHFPPTSWLCYTGAGADAAGHSNIAIGYWGSDAIDAYMSDGGTGNEPVGHRRWILFPRQQAFGVGSIPPASGRPASNALWVLGPFGSRPASPEFVAWPPSGFVPYDMLPNSNRWSFSYPGADFAGTTVSVSRAGVPLTVVPVGYDNLGYGDATTVFSVPAYSATRPSSDIVHHVDVKGVLVGGIPRDFSYDVVSINPVIAAHDASGDQKSDVLLQHTDGRTYAWTRSATAPE
jgi:uncharacterized protein YkwD